MRREPRVGGLNSSLFREGYFQLYLRQFTPSPKKWRVDDDVRGYINSLLSPARHTFSLSLSLSSLLPLSERNRPRRFDWTKRNEVALRSPPVGWNERKKKMLIDRIEICFFKSKLRMNDKFEDDASTKGGELLHHRVINWKIKRMETSIERIASQLRSLLDVFSVVIPR